MAEPALYLLITNQRLAPDFQSLVRRRTEQGFTGRLLTVESIHASYPGRDEPERIRNCIIDHYVRFGTRYVALGGDETVVPVRYGCPRSIDEKVPVDLYYSDTDGGDWDSNRNGVYGQVGDVGEIELIPEVHLGRIPVRTSADVTTYVNKLTTYETASSDGFADSAIIFGGTKELLSGNSRPPGFTHHDPVEVREINLAGYYLDWIQPYWQAVPFHLYCDTSSPWDVSAYGDYGLSVNGLAEHLDSGPFGRGYHFILYSGHANYTCYAMGEGRRFNTGHASGVANAVPCIVISGGCGPAGFDQAEPCLSEAFLRNPNGGAVAFFGYARSVSDGSHRDQLFLSIFKNRLKILGEAVSHCKAALASAYVSKPFHHYNFHLQGDPCIQLLSGESGRHVQLLQPRGCEILPPGSDVYIRWNAAGTGFGPRESVKLEYSPDGGRAWHTVPRAEVLPYNARLFIWQKCNLSPGSTYRMRVVSLADRSVSDMSARNFAVAEMGILTVNSTPVSGIPMSGTHANQTNYTFSVLKGASVSLTAPGVPDFDFVRWADARGHTVRQSPDCTFTFSNDTTLVAEYSYSRPTTYYYVNDETPEQGFASGDDRNGGLTAQTPMRHIQVLLDRYTTLGLGSTISISAGTYDENIRLRAGHTGLELRGAGQDLCIVDGGGRGSCITLDGFAAGTISGLTIQHGLSDRGGGIYCQNSSPVIRECTLADNTANTYGGGMFVRSASPDLSDCIFAGNSAARGGGLCDYGGASVVRGCLFENNDARLYGGGLYNTSGGKPKLTNCIFHANSAKRGGAVTVTDDSSRTTMTNCTLGSNQARAGSREIIWIAVPGSAMELRNCIVYDAAPSISTLIATEGSLEIRFGLVKGGPNGISESQSAAVSWGQGNMSGDPLFADPGTGDYHVRSRVGRWVAGGRAAWVTDNVTSPCIDAGDPDVPAGDEPEPNGGRINMGAYGGTAEASKSP